MNDTVVVFDRIRERSKDAADLPPAAVIKGVRHVDPHALRTGTTLLPLLLRVFRGATLCWFAIALALGVVVGSWSSIALAPSLLTLWDRSRD